MTRAATAEDYRLIFEDTMAGQLVMEDLMKRFAGVVYVGEAMKPTVRPVTEQVNAM